VRDSECETRERAREGRNEREGKTVREAERDAERERPWRETERGCGREIERRTE
jgi:hypothetical protein